ncbi:MULTISPECIES: hypothetical protein [Sphingomonadales]|uniref:Uncharacterized protein n=2 Tax=Edaphosphingomonas TaxID=3423724 RepID=A0A2T4HLM3_9SPHN|nr:MULTISPECIES: hypothetical protein [Sphingomonas]AGH48999.1 hypothetical protein G432_06360 [Sphingomonas sp. MM-1]MDX3885334.1 hypothetical protein [Sphingomonas sp.]OHT21418.1 hypothetical protein BHE75_03425 [Sphingomonas haloaromaticamans]PTD16676.1 hypothetical protein CV103_20535 [Sphingomonas fennica]
MFGMTASFCERRALEELRAAEEATCLEAAASHRQLAREFAARARALRAEAEAARHIQIDAVAG